MKRKSVPSAKATASGNGGTVSDPVILIEIDPALSGGFIGDRFDIMIRGRVMSTGSIRDVRLQDAGRTVAAESYDMTSGAPTCLMPDGKPGTQRAFHFNLPRLGVGQLGRCSVQIVARTKEGAEQVENFEIHVDPDTADPVSLISGPRRSAPASRGALPYAVLFIERATIDRRNRLAVAGWGVAFGAIQSIRLSVGDRLVADAVLDVERHDVASIYAAYPDARSSGFSLVIPLDAAIPLVDPVRVQIVCANGFRHEESVPVERVDAAGPRDAPPPGHADAETLQPLTVPATIEMYCDAASLTGDGVLSINGWAVCSAGIAQVRVLLDDQDVGLATFGHERLDIAASFPDIRMAFLAGFQFDRRLGERYEGKHQVRIVVSGAHGGESFKQIEAVVTEPAAPPSATPDERPIEVAPALTAAQRDEFRFELDAPTLANGAMVEPVTGRLTIEGWLLTRSGVASFDVWLGDQLLGEAHYGLARQDVGGAFPDWPNALRSGFAFHCPPRGLRDGEHTVRLVIRANNGRTMERSFRAVVKKADSHNDAVAIRRRIPRVEADMMLAALAGMENRPDFRFVLRLDIPIHEDRLRATLDALRLQAYPDWSLLILAADGQAATAANSILADQAPQLRERCVVLSPGDEAAWAAPLARSGPQHYGLLSAGDEPGADALLEFALAAYHHPGHDLFYGDEVRTSPVSGETEPFFKPDFSPDLLLSTNYIGRIWVAAAALIAKTGVTLADLALAGEYDLLLRCAEEAAGVHHIPKLLCQRTGGALDEPALEQAALERMLQRRDIAGTVLATPILGTWRVKRAIPSKGKVSIIIPTCAANGYIDTCIKTLREKTSYPNYEIICIDNIPAAEGNWKLWLQRHADKVVDLPGAFNWSVFNNRAAEAADGDYLLFLNDDIEIIHDDWLDALVEHAQRPDVGIVGPQLLYRDGTVQHAGMFLSTIGIGRHAFRFAAKDDPCYFGLALTQRNVIAVTGACMLVRRETFQRLGQFDEAHQIVNNDLDFCLRVHRAGLLTVYSPYASLIHYELASRAGMKDIYDLTHFNAAWKTTFAAGDPYFSPRLVKLAEDYHPDDEPVQWVVSGAPLFHVAEIERILVVKLDHIGDFVTALPPIRRLRSIFPRAHITVLAGPASRDFIALEPSIDEFIPFSFFHSRSQLGERELTADDYTALAAQLRPRRFDLAVDLRKHPSTRDVLKHTGARFLAGFDYLGQFPFLDIALDWDGDRTLQRKRSHIVDDLLGLVNAIGHATENDRALMQPAPPPMDLRQLPQEARRLFTKPVVAIHPGAGNITKQWPEENFSALIDLLIERKDVNVLLVGGPDDAAISLRLTESVLHTGSIASMAGKTSLADLARLLRNCVLYIGNDSGPKHIAAAVGIPTIGIHSGVVDPVEWGPIGPNAVALRRNMACSPCYLAKADDCPRALACLRFFEPSMVYETASMMLNPTRRGLLAIQDGTIDEAAPPPPAAKPARKAKARRGHPVSEPV